MDTPFPDYLRGTQEFQEAYNRALQRYEREREYFLTVHPPFPFGAVCGEMTEEEFNRAWGDD